jgi:hypothetical protein
MIYNPNFGVSHSHERLLETYQILLLEPYQYIPIGLPGSELQVLLQDAAAAMARAPGKD